MLPQMMPPHFVLNVDQANHCYALSAVHSWVQLLVTPWSVSRQAPLSLEYPKQEYWSRLPFSTPGDLPNPGIEPTSVVSSVLADRFFNIVPLGKPF